MVFLQLQYPNIFSQDNLIPHHQSVANFVVAVCVLHKTNAQLIEDPHLGSYLE